MKNEKENQEFADRLLSSLPKELAEPPAGLRDKVMRSATGREAKTSPAFNRRLVPAMALATLVAVFAAVLGLSQHTSNEDVQAVNQYLSKVSTYLQSDISWVEPAGKFGNF